jgi:hypothetical protein
MVASASPHPDGAIERLQRNPVNLVNIVNFDLT